MTNRINLIRTDREEKGNMEWSVASFCKEVKKRHGLEEPFSLVFAFDHK